MKQVPLEGLYIGQRLMEMSTKIGRSLVLADFLTDKNGVVAKAEKNGHSQIPMELKNPYDWGLFQELMAQADVIICGGTYLKSLATLGNNAQDILYQFEPGKPFEKLGEWRLKAGYEKRSPDLAVVTRDLDFDIPKELTLGRRKFTILTTDAIANSNKAESLNKADTTVIGCGDAGVDGNRMIATLGSGMGYRVIMMASGPSVLELLIAAKCLDLLYVTQVQLEIALGGSETVQTILSGGKKINDLKEFDLAQQYIQENVAAEDGSSISQLFLRYDKKTWESKPE